MSEKAISIQSRKIKATGVRRLAYRSIGGNIGIFIFLALVSAFMILPMLYAVLQSLKPLDEIFAYPPRFFVRNPTLKNYSQLFKLANSLWVPFSRYLFNSLYVSVLSTTLYIFIAVMAGYSLSKGKFPGVNLISNLVVWTMLFRSEVLAVPQYLVISAFGMVDTHSSIILPAMAATMGVFLMKQFMITAIPDSVLEAARIDGAGEMRIVRSIVFPCVKPCILTLIIFTFQSMWNNTGGNYIYSESLKMLPSALSTIISSGIARAGAGAAVSVILMIPPIIVFLYSQNSVMETMSHSGLK